MRKSSSRLRAVREAQGKSLASLAREADVDLGYLSKIERGLKEPSVATLLKIGRALGLRDYVKALELFPGAGE